MKIRVVMLACVAAATAGCQKTPAQAPIATADTATPSARLPVEHWGRKLSATSRAEYQGALGMLGQYGHEAVPYIPAIARYLESSHDSVGFTAAWTLAQIGPESEPPLVQALSNASPQVRRRAAYSLGEMGADAEATLPALNKVANNDPVIEVRYMAQWAVDKISNRSLIADPDLFLRAGLSAADLQTRFEAIRRLGAAHPSDGVAVQELIRLLGDSVEVIRYAAIDALVEKGSPALPSLTMALSNPRRIVRTGAMMAMARMNRIF